MDIDTVITLIISGTLTGLGIGLGFWLLSRHFIKQIVKFVPDWIHEVMQESRKNMAVERALSSRGKYDGEV